MNAHSRLVVALLVGTIDNSLTVKAAEVSVVFPQQNTQQSVLISNRNDTKKSVLEMLDFGYMVKTGEHEERHTTQMQIQEKCLVLFLVLSFMMFLKS